jgi:hypothetical protein
MKRRISFLLAGFLILALTACSAGPANNNTASTSASPTQTAASSAGSALSTGTAGSASSTGTPVPTAAPSGAQALADNEKTHEDPADNTYDISTAIPIHLNGSSIQAEKGVVVSGSKATITSPGQYVIDGALTDGQIVVDTAVKATVWLILNGVDIHSSDNAPIFILKAQKVVIVLADKTVNKLSDGTTYTSNLPEDDQPDAALFSKSDLTLCGNGSLAVKANYQDGIASKDGLIIAGGNVTVDAPDDGIRGKDYLVVKDGTLTVKAQGDGLKSDNEKDAKRGYISIAAGTFDIDAGGDAVTASTDVVIQGGAFDIVSGGGSSQPKDDAVSQKGIKGAVGVYIDGGTIKIDATDDAIHSGGNVGINAGTVSLSTADDGIHADAALTVNGGDITIARSYEGIESAVVTIHAGTIHVNSSDDGINISSKDSSAGVDPGLGGGKMAGRSVGQPGGSLDQNNSASTGNLILSIHGGYLYVDANGDGLDSNGSIEMTGGVVIVNGPTQQNNGALDYNNGFKITGGWIVAVGSSGMAQAPDTSSSQFAALINLTSAQSAGTLIHIQDSTGKEILTFAPTKNYQSIAFSSPDLAQGAIYTYYAGGNSSGTIQDGRYTDGRYTPGVQSGNFTIQDTVTMVGSGNRGGPGPRR